MKISMWLIFTTILLWQVSFLGPVFAADQTTSEKDAAFIGKINEYAEAIDNPGRPEKRAERAKLYHEARRLIKQGFFEDALRKYQEALDPRLVDVEDDKVHPLFGIMDVHQLQGKYDLCLEEVDWFIKLAPWKDEYQQKKQELEALILARNTNSFHPVYDHIKKVSEKYYRSIPPSRVDTYGEILFGNFAYLYDIIGDFDAGIALCDNFAKHATQKPRIQSQYLAIRRAFEEDKKDGRKSYITKPGKLGRATKALIQSDYFTW
ncbi:MAG: hypothetical protein BWZ03_00414 [bacterium ADurb.BinA186]|nr:MAG: hypothetical protein BWZ03_00414 [bacterium ADurb.BinA186]